MSVDKSRNQNTNGGAVGRTTRLWPLHCLESGERNNRWPHKDIIHLTTAGGYCTRLTRAPTRLTELRSGIPIQLRHSCHRHRLALQQSAHPTPNRTALDIAQVSQSDAKRIHSSDLLESHYTSSRILIIRQCPHAPVEQRSGIRVFIRHHLDMFVLLFVGAWGRPSIFT